MMSEWNILVRTIVELLEVQYFKYWLSAHRNYKVWFYPMHVPDADAGNFEVNPHLAYSVGYVFQIVADGKSTAYKFTANQDIDLVDKIAVTYLVEKAKTPDNMELPEDYLWNLIWDMGQFDLTSDYAAPTCLEDCFNEYTEIKDFDPCGMTEYHEWSFV